MAGFRSSRNALKRIKMPRNEAEKDYKRLHKIRRGDNVIE